MIHKLAKPVALSVALFAALFLALFAFVKIANSELPKDRASRPLPEIKFREGKFHPATGTMLAAASKFNGAPAPDFAAPDLDGKSWTLQSLTSGKPLVLYFIEYQCPCCKSAKPFIDRLENYYGDVANVVGIVDVGGDLAAAWSQTTGPQFQVLSDPQMKIIKAYKAYRGTHTVLIDPSGRIIKAYPGYSRTMLDEIATTISQLTGITKRKMPFEDAPKKMTSGCVFPGIELPEDQL